LNYRAGIGGTRDKGRGTSSVGVGAGVGMGHECDREAKIFKIIGLAKLLFNVRGLKFVVGL